jgi:hypothetical protein
MVKSEMKNIIKTGLGTSNGCSSPCDIGDLLDVVVFASAICKWGGNTKSYLL